MSASHNNVQQALAFLKQSGAGEFKFKQNDHYAGSVSLSDVCNQFFAGDDLVARADFAQQVRREHNRSLLQLN